MKGVKTLKPYMYTGKSWDVTNTCMFMNKESSHQLSKISITGRQKIYLPGAGLFKKYSMQRT